MHRLAMAMEITNTNKYLIAMIMTMNMLCQRFVVSFTLRNNGYLGPRIRNAATGNSIISGGHLAIQFPSSVLQMSTTSDQAEGVKSIDSTWDVAGLKKEVQRLTLRCHKKVGKANIRLNRANEEVEELRTNPDVTDEQLQACPDITSMENEVETLRERLSNLTRLEELLTKVKNGKAVVLDEDIATLAIQLEVNDQPPQRAPRGPKKKKGPRTESPRKPYFRYYSKGKTEIRVGRRSEDNDELSCNPKHRDGADWWMHAAGCPGSHVVIRCHDAELDKDVIMDAASLAARQSKCQGSTIKVSLTRCRDVKKPPGAKAGLVTLTGMVQTVTVNMKQVEKRLLRLDDTIVKN